MAALARAAHSDTGAIAGLELMLTSLRSPTPSHPPPSYEEALNCRSVAVSPGSSPRQFAGSASGNQPFRADPPPQPPRIADAAALAVSPVSRSVALGDGAQQQSPFTSPGSAVKSGRSSVVHRLARTSNTGSNTGSPRVSSSDNVSITDQAADTHATGGNTPTRSTSTGRASQKNLASVFESPTAQPDFTQAETAAPEMPSADASSDVNTVVETAAEETGGETDGDKTDAVDLDIKAYVANLLGLDASQASQQGAAGVDRRSNAGSTSGADALN